MSASQTGRCLFDSRFQGVSVWSNNNYHHRPSSFTDSLHMRVRTCVYRVGNGDGLWRSFLRRLCQSWCMDSRVCGKCLRIGGNRWRSNPYLSCMCSLITRLWYPSPRGTGTRMRMMSHRSSFSSHHYGDPHKRKVREGARGTQR